ncbi:hypothetical protein PoB_004107200 [Plakobranchus ocellatus]|uniref:Uncharacterized protein n=1 Tax=Plakobranchus ocellatus TaxID=259542 RepID=A0AAV4B648_9GAST|nr:hypothetical protein PoB_004107200 [Plakobranchus ocellatus]
MKTSRHDITVKKRRKFGVRKSGRKSDKIQNKVISGFSGPPSGQGAGGGARTCGRRVPAYLRADSLATVPPTSQEILKS